MYTSRPLIRPCISAETRTTDNLWVFFGAAKVVSAIQIDWAYESSLLFIIINTKLTCPMDVRNALPQWVTHSSAVERTLYKHGQRTHVTRDFQRTQQRVRYPTDTRRIFRHRATLSWAHASPIYGKICFFNNSSGLAGRAGGPSCHAGAVLPHLLLLQL